MKKFLNSNVTWGGYFKLAGIVMVIYAIITGAWIAWFFELPQKAIAKLKKIFHR